MVGIIGNIFLTIPGSNKELLKARIKKIYIDGAMENKADISKIDPIVDKVAEELSTAIELYLKDEFARLKEALTQPGAYTATSVGAPIQITPGTIKDYQP